MLRMRVMAVTGALACLAAGQALAQEGQATGPVTVAPLVGFMKFDEGAALDDAAFAGLAASYRVARGVSLGAYIEGGRTSTLGNYFPMALLRYQTSTQLFTVSQRVTVLSWGGTANYTFGLGGVNAYVGAGLGRWNVHPDVEQSKSAETFGGLEWSLGGGLGIELGGTASLRFDLRSVNYRDFERSRLNAVTENYQNTLFPDVQDYPNRVPRVECNTEKCNMSNWRFGVAFVFFPQGAR